MDGVVALEVRTPANRTILTIPDEQDLEAQVALTPRIAEHAYAVRHRGYYAHGYIASSEDNLFQDKYDKLQNQKTVVLYRESEPIATLRICLFDSENHWPDAISVPAMEVFGKEINELREAVSKISGGCRIIEIGRLAIDPSHANDRKLLIAGFRMVAYLRLYFDADIMINAVHSRHMPIYRRLGFQEIEGPRQYPNVNFQAALMAMFRPNYDSALAKIGFPHGISMEDPVYSSLISGERVPIFPKAPESNGSTRLSILPPNLSLAA